MSNHEYKIERSRHGWSRKLFSESVTVKGPHSTIYFAGIGPEDEEDGTIRHLGDFAAQCAYTHDKLVRTLERHGASLDNVVKVVAYLTDIRYKSAYSEYRRSLWAETILPAHTFLVVSALAHPGMLVEIDVTAVVPQGE